MSFKELFVLPLLPLIAAKSQKRQRHSAGKAGEPPKLNFELRISLYRWVWVRVLGYGFGVRGRKVKSRDCALASDLVRAQVLSLTAFTKSIAYKLSRDFGFY